MQSAKFFPGANRRVTIGSPTKQCSSGRIVFPVSMPLTGESVVSMPEWVGNAYTAVSQSFTEVNPEVQEVSEISLAFSNDAPTDELFAPPSAMLPCASLKGFKIVRAGEAEEPEVELHFKAYGPFAREFWAWIGEMAGHEVYMAFPATVGGTVAVSNSFPLLDDDDLEAERVENLGPEHDADFGARDEARADGIPVDPTLEDALGPEYEARVRKSMGAPEPFSEKPRIVDARRKGGKPGKKHSTLAVN